VPVDTVHGAITCKPAGLALGPHTFAGRFSGGIGYAASDAAPVDFTVLQPQTVTFDAPTGVTYGDADLALGATASSGLPVSYSSSTPDVCTTTGAGALHVVAAGTCTVTAAQAGSSTYAPAQQSRTFSIAKATLTVTADDQSRAFGSANPPLTATITGYLDGDPPSVVSGTPVLSTTAATDSAPGDYPIAVNTSGLTAEDYDFVGVSGTLTVTKARSTTALTAAPYPSWLNRAVTLTATVSTSVTGVAAPSGTVAFYVDGATTPAARASVVDGQASALALLAGGAHTVVARYSGDDFYLASVSAPPTDASVTCTQMVSGRYGHSLAVSSGTTCVLPGTTIAGSIRVARGASLDLEGATVRGLIAAVAPDAIRMCGSSARAITVKDATGFVLVGDPEHDCAPNGVSGSMILTGNHAGLVAVDNTVDGTVLARDNSGAGPLPGQETPIVTGNHR
jgi:hypothetical protein